MSRRDPDKKATLHIPVSTALLTALELEAWECQLTLQAYVAGLLTRRGRWARTVRRGPPVYDLQAELPPSQRNLRDGN